MVRFNTPTETREPASLAAITGPIRSLTRSSLATVGYTGASHERIDLVLESGAHRSLVVKRTRPSADWTAMRTADRIGREAAMLGEPLLAPVWNAFACPYLGFATGTDEIALVMDDLTPWLLPDVRSPLSDHEEERLLRSLATLHAQFWSPSGNPSSALDLPILAKPEQYIGMLDACCAADSRAIAVLPEGLRENVARGWAAAVEELPPALFALMTTPAEEMTPFWERLPRTLVHGDVKVANFALLPDGRVAAFDWALLGAGPAAIDIGWYLAVNATRLSQSKEHALERYRRLLDDQLGTPLSGPVWATLAQSAIVFGARMLLWSKALAVEADRPGAAAEWNWWIERLEAACS